MSAVFEVKVVTEDAVKVPTFMGPVKLPVSKVEVTIRNNFWGVNFHSKTRVVTKNGLVLPLESWLEWDHK